MLVTIVYVQKQINVMKQRHEVYDSEIFQTCVEYSWRLSHVTSTDSDVIKTLIHVYAPCLTEESLLFDDINQAKLINLNPRRLNEGTL